MTRMADAKCAQAGADESSALRRGPIRKLMDGRRILALALAAVLAWPGASAAFHGRDVAGAGYARDFALRDPDGTMRRLSDFSGKVVVMTFGYLQCPNFCPLTLAKLTEALGDLGAEARRVQVLFVTLDPARDVPEALRQYVTAFDPSFIALRPEEADTRDFALAFRIYYERVQAPGREGYDIDHATFSYVFDARGRLRLVLPFDQTARQISEDLRKLLAEGG